MRDTDNTGTTVTEVDRIREEISRSVLSPEKQDELLSKILALPKDELPLAVPKILYVLHQLPSDPAAVAQTFRWEARRGNAGEDRRKVIRRWKRRLARVSPVRPPKRPARPRATTRSEPRPRSTSRRSTGTSSSRGDPGDDDGGDGDGPGDDPVSRRVRELVSQAPPLSAGQRDRLAAIFRGVGAR